MTIPQSHPFPSDTWDDPVSDSPSGDVARIALVLDEYVHLRGLGQQPERGEFLARHAAIADELADCLDGLDFVLSARDDDLLATDDPDESGGEDHRLSERLGDYRLIREVGRGGMGVVYEAEQLSLGRRVVLKVLLSSASMDSRQRQRFQLEAQVIALLQHEHIVPVYGVGSDEGFHYFAMRFIEGRSLAEMVQEFRAAERARERGLPEGRRVGSRSSSRSSARWRTVAQYGIQAAEALQHAHDAGVIHRDIKPSNLMVDSHGQLWVTDFGLAHLPQDDPSLTGSGDLVGTLRYMSPEQVRGDRHAVDARTDVYALGLTLYELLTLRPAFVAAGRENLLRQILQDEPVAPRRINPSISRDLETIVLKAIAKEPAARYSTAHELATDLGRFLDDRPIRARRPTLAERSLRWSRRHRAVVLTAVTVLFMTLSIGTALLWRAKERTDAALQIQKQVLLQMRFATEHSIAQFDQIAQIFSDPSKDSEPLRSMEADQFYRSAIQYYNQLVRMPHEDQLVSELRAKLWRRLGFFRMVLGETAGCDDYERAIRIYESLIHQHPDWIWLQTGLIETLHEYSKRLSRSGDPSAAELRFRHALQLAENLVGNPAAAAPCYHKALIEPFNRLASDLLACPSLPQADLALAIRLARQALEWESTKGLDVPGVPRAHRILGVAYCRAGDWGAATSAVETGMTSNGSADPRDRLFLAILQGRWGHLANSPASRNDPGGVLLWVSGRLKMVARTWK